MTLIPYLKTVYICSKCRGEYDVWPYDHSVECPEQASGPDGQEDQPQG